MRSRKISPEAHRLRMQRRAMRRELDRAELERQRAAAEARARAERRELSTLEKHGKEVAE